MGGREEGGKSILGLNICGTTMKSGGIFFSMHVIQGKVAVYYFLKN